MGTGPVAFERRGLCHARSQGLAAVVTYKGLANGGPGAMTSVTWQGYRDM
ncbi:hypothetical protein [Streptomyces rhizosphaerihabitans]|nr:hypothetical protein [Streptomyces rhizosphaerihabitans]MCT9011406.1 hypothetical protein [Streptomyces rhizosphaerihabitans]